MPVGVKRNIGVRKISAVQTRITSPRKLRTIRRHFPPSSSQLQHLNRSLFRGWPKRLKMNDRGSRSTNRLLVGWRLTRITTTTVMMRRGLRSPKLNAKAQRVPTRSVLLLGVTDWCVTGMSMLLKVLWFDLSVREIGAMRDVQHSAMLGGSDGLWEIVQKRVYDEHFLA
jgi:hypothetical protein